MTAKAAFVYMQHASSTERELHTYSSNMLNSALGATKLPPPEVTWLLLDPPTPADSRMPGHCCRSAAVSSTSRRTD
jgi:hypothetical protein